MVIITQLLLSTVETLQLSDGGSVSEEFGNRSTLLWPGKGKAGKSCPTRDLPLWIFDGSIFAQKGALPALARTSASMPQYAGLAAKGRVARLKSDEDPEFNAAVIEDILALNAAAPSIGRRGRRLAWLQLSPRAKGFLTNAAHAAKCCRGFRSSFPGRRVWNGRCALRIAAAVSSRHAPRQPSHLRRVVGPGWRVRGLQS
jgi:hypothetical protein